MQPVGAIVSCSAMIWGIRWRRSRLTCVCLQVEPSSPPATVPPSPSIIHGGCQTSRTRPQFFLPAFQNFGWIYYLQKIFPSFLRISLLRVLVEYSWMKYGSWESDGLLHIFGWFPNWWKVQRVWEERWVVWARGSSRQQLDLRDDSSPAMPHFAICYTTLCVSRKKWKATHMGALPIRLNSHNLPSGRVVQRKQTRILANLPLALHIGGWQYCGKTLCYTVAQESVFKKTRYRRPLQFAQRALLCLYCSLQQGLTEWEWSLGSSPLHYCHCFLHLICFVIVSCVLFLTPNENDTGMGPLICWCSIWCVFTADSALLLADSHSPPLVGGWESKTQSWRVRWCSLNRIKHGTRLWSRLLNTWWHSRACR